MRNMKILGLLVVSAMALVAFVGTSSASATAFTAAAEGEALSTGVVEGQDHVFSVEGSEVECEEIAFAGETEGTATAQQIVSPSYKKCKAFGFPAATVTTNGCEYEFKAATDVTVIEEVPVQTPHATVRLFGCGDGSDAAKTKGIQIDVNILFTARCIVDVPEQSIKEAVHYTNIGTPPDTIRVEATATGIMNDVTTSTGLCPLKVGTNSTGEYDGASDVTTPEGIEYSP